MALDTRDIVGWIREHCLVAEPERELTPDAPLLDDGILDSIQIMQLVSFVEEQAQVTVPLDEIVPESFETARSIAAMVARIAARR